MDPENLAKIIHLNMPYDQKTHGVIFISVLAIPPQTPQTHLLSKEKEKKNHSTVQYILTFFTSKEKFYFLTFA